MKRTPVISLVMATCLLGLNQIQACPVCFQSGGEERWAFYGTTAFLTMLPLAGVGLAVYLLHKRAQKLNSEESD